MIQTLKLSAIAFVFANFAFASLCFAECHLGSNGQHYCGDTCALNSDGTWSCANDGGHWGRGGGDSSGPVECHLGSNGHQYCGRDCNLNGNGTWSCN